MYCVLCKVHPELLFTPHTHPGLTDQLPWLAKAELTHLMVPTYSDLNGKQDVGYTVALNIGYTVAEALETGRFFRDGQMNQERES